MTPWADGNTSPTRKRGVGTIPRLRVGLVLKPLVQLLAAISSAQHDPLGRAILGPVAPKPSGPQATFNFFVAPNRSELCQPQYRPPMNLVLRVQTLGELGGQIQ